jgi:iron(III) transport system substrate-binding protein
MRRRTGPAACWRALAAIAAVALAAAALAACGGAASGAATQSITLYNGQHEQTTDALVAGFEKATGITVNVRNDDEDTLADDIVGEGSHSPADVIFTENSQVLEFLQGKGLLAHVNAATLAHTPSQYNSPQGDWVGVSARVSVLIYNPSLIKESQLPTSVLQLASPKYAGKLAIAPQETDFQPIVTSVARAYGQAAALRWLDGIKANAGGHVYPDNETIADEVNRGAAAFGIVNQYYWYRMRAEIGTAGTHARIAYFAPRDPGYVVDVSGAAVLKSSTHAAAAQEFLAYLVSAQAQEIIANPARSISFEYPIASGVTTQAGETPFAQLQPYQISVAELGSGTTAINLMRQAGLL